MDYIYKLTLLLLICVIYNRVSVKRWKTVVIDDSLISKALNDVNSVVGKHKGGINFLKHNMDSVKKTGLRDNLMQAFQKANGGNHVTPESMKLYIQKLKDQASNKEFDVSKLSPSTAIDPSVLASLNNNSNLFDYNSIKGSVLDKIQNSKSGTINVAQEILNEKLQKLELSSKIKQIKQIDSVSKQLQPTKYGKLYSMKEIKESILSELPDDIKTKVLMDLEKKQFGGSYFTNMEKKVAGGLSPHSPISLAKYWFINMFPIMIILGIVCIIIINAYSEFEENTEEKDTTQKFKNILSYLGDNIYSVIIPSLLYCVARFVFDLLKFDGFIIPVLGEIVEVVERIPVLWTCIFGSIITSLYMKLIMSADLGNPECPLNSKTKNKYKERCFPFFWDEKCPEESSSFSCWFKI